jgi:hypothetical protein
MCDIFVIYVSILCEPDHQYLLTIGSTEEKTEGISTDDFSEDHVREELTEMQRDLASMSIANRMFCRDMMGFGNDNPMEDSNI